MGAPNRETSEAYLVGYFFRSDGRWPERRFNAVVNEIKAYAKGVFNCLRTARAAEE
jgi:hypothetical protein